MSALQSDLFGLMGEGDIQSCGPEIGLISAQRTQSVNAPLQESITMITVQLMQLMVKPLGL